MNKSDIYFEIKNQFILCETSEEIELKLTEINSLVMTAYNSTISRKEVIEEWNNVID